MCAKVNRRLLMLLLLLLLLMVLLQMSLLSLMLPVAMLPVAMLPVMFTGSDEDIFFSEVIIKMCVCLNIERCCCW